MEEQESTFGDYQAVLVEGRPGEGAKRKMTIAGLLLAQRVNEKRFRVTRHVRVKTTRSGTNC
jgi:hypothetical protein